MLVRYWMTADPITTTEGTSLLRVLETMRQNKVRRLPVVRGDELCGIISISDLYRYVDPIVTSKSSIPEVVIDELGHRTVKQIMVPSPITCELNTALEDLAQTMRVNKIGAVPVVKKGSVVGMITESDVLGALATLARQGADGKRVSFKLPTEGKREVFYRIVELCERHHVDLLTVLTHPMPDENAHLVTIRFQGGDADKLVEALWESECQVLQVTG